MEYLEHLDKNRWNAVRFINGKGIEVSNNKFTVFPKAIKIVADDKPVLNNQIRFKVNDINNPIEIEDNSLDYVFITMEVLPDLDKYRSKLKSTGYLIYHTLINNQWEFIVENYKKPILPKNNVLVIRYGAIGDLFQASSVCAALKKQGKYVIVHAQNPSSEVLHNNPNIDELISTDREIVRNSELRLYWDWLETQYNQVVNLCGSVEDALLPNHTRPQFFWPVKIRNRYLNYNYVKFQHELADTPYKLDIKFYPTNEEIQFAKEERAKINSKKIICWALNGSSLHKIFPYFDEFVARVMLLEQDCDIVTLGDENAQFLEQGWQKEKRVHRKSGIWSIRQAITFVQQHCHLLIGPETGILNAVCIEDLHKIIFLSHSTINNLTKDWKNTISLSPPPGTNDDCIHRLHQNDVEWQYLKRDEVTGCHYGQSRIDRNKLWEHTQRILRNIK